MVIAKKNKSKLKKGTVRIIYFFANILGVKKRFLYWLLLFSITLFLIQGYANYQYSQILDRLKLEPDLELEISPFLYESTFGEYLPFIITNTGDFTLEKVNIYLQTCQMEEQNESEHYTLLLLPSHSERIIPFGNPETIELFKSGNCYPFAGEDRERGEFNALIRLPIKDHVKVITTACSYCKFNATITAEYKDRDEIKNFSKFVSSSFLSPRTYALIVSVPKK